MNYGYFDDEKKEYVITRPDTPTPWTNYLGTMKYGAIITNNAAGYSFVNSGADGKILRFRFNACMSNMPGRYIYIRDKEDGDYWSASWQPVGKNLQKYESICKHGTAYTEITSRYNDIHTTTLYYVPLEQSYEVWNFKIRNMSSCIRRLSIYTYAEFTNHNSEVMDINNLQYTQYISRTEYHGNYILQLLNEFSDERDFRFFGVSREDVAGWDGDREQFLGLYGSYNNPEVVMSGKCNNSLNYTGNSCGVFQIDMELQPEEEKEIIFTLGIGNRDVASSVVEKYDLVNSVEKELEELKKYWHSKLEMFQVKTLDENLNRMINVWHSYECFVNTFWSRTASLIYSNGRNGLGYRDTIADIQSIMHLDSKLARERLVTIISGQVSNGGALPLVRFDHNPGHEYLPDTSEYMQRTGYDNYRCDDGLWLFSAVQQYIKESGENSFLDIIIPYSDCGETTVYLHLKQALIFSLNKLGKNGLLVAIDNDWNDCLKLGDKGESVFASFQLYQALTIFGELAERTNNEKDMEWVENNKSLLYKNIQSKCWDGDQFIRAITEDGYVIGKADSEEAALWLNPQAWAVISGVATKEQAEKAIEKVHRILQTEYGTMLFYPSFRKYGLPVARMVLYLPGIKENASVFLMAEAWIIQAETMLGHGNRAWEYYNSTNPATYNEHCETHQTEPYVYGQFVDGIESPNFGRARGHWLTGSASSIMLSVVEGILGIKADYDGIIIDPCIPVEWDRFSVSRVFREKILNIVVENPNGIQKGISRILLNDEQLEDTTFIPLARMKKVNEVKVIMGY